MSVSRSFRFLQQPTAPNSSASASPPPVPAESDVIIILAALLCALICVVGLALVARCAWLRRTLSGGGDAATARQELPTSTAATTTPAPPPNKGLKKKVLRSLPKLTFDQAFPPGGSSSPAAPKLPAECPICLADFAAGDEIRVLPHCGHGFHVACVDTWLGSHSSCPSCRQILVAAPGANRRCNKCGASSADTNSGGGGQGPSSSSSSSTAAAAAAVAEARAKGREDRDAGRFLP